MSKRSVGNSIILSPYKATEIASKPIAFIEGMEFETDQTDFVAKCVFQITANSKGIEVIH
jgi:hypothetical protein